jgi:hypothetical protein
MREHKFLHGHIKEGIVIVSHQDGFWRSKYTEDMNLNSDKNDAQDMSRWIS